MTTTPSRPPDLLEAILAATRQEVDLRRHRTGYHAPERQAAARTPRGEAFRASLTRADRVNVIAECKRRSPSRGVLRSDYDPAAIARTYEASGAAAISVLTEPAFFDGALSHLEQVRAAVDIPILRKDFIVSSLQLAEACAAGADAVLLIVAALEDRDLARLHHDARAAGLAVLVEVHDETELARALDAGAEIVGVNNRNLRTLEVDLQASHRLVAKMPPGVVKVAESGIGSAADIRKLREVGYDAFLVGERLMLSDEPSDTLRQLLGDAERRG